MPIDWVVSEAMFYRVEVNIVYMSFQVLFIFDNVVPESTLPDCCLMVFLA